jgi:hypothetical protein
MTQEEANKILAILHQADGGCPSCVRELVGLAEEAFPELKWEEQDDRN